jgi:two-component system NtrC family sensor kinase
MTIRNRIIIAVVVQAAIICIICVFVYLSFNTVLSKLRTIEIIDDLNISFLEIRKSEKNYFLYSDVNALKEVVEIGDEIDKIIQSSKVDILKSLGPKTYDTLRNNLNKYLDMARAVIATKETPVKFEEEFRSLGHELTRLSEVLLKRERRDVNNIISTSITRLIASLGVVLLFQLVVWQYFFRFLIKELAIMGNLIQMVSRGKLHEVAKQTFSPKNEIDYAIKALADMARELEKREAVLLQSEKLASLGILISGVAHELGNPLNNISLMAQGYLSLYDILGDGEKKNFMADVLTQTERISKIINNLLDFSRQKKQELKEYEAENIIERSIALVSNQIKISNVKLHKFIKPNLPHIYVDAPQIEQVLVNLLINAIQAMPAGGDLTINVGQDRRNGYLIIKVKDTGAGISKEDLPHVFDPFFTTKGTKGTGLGLSVSYGIIQQHRGDIAVESEEGQGTTFTLKIPIYQPKERATDAQSDLDH